MKLLTSNLLMNLFWVLSILTLNFISCIYKCKNSNYQSLNYQYFKRKFTNFLYVDRVAVVDKAQRMGVGSRIYKKLYEISSNSSVPLCCEVNTVPLNQQSLDFHSKQKFEIIEELKFGKKRVAMQVKYWNPPKLILWLLS